MVISSVCLTPVMALILLLFKRTSPPRPQLEDRWIGAPRSEIPKKVVAAVKCREEQLLAQRAVKRVEEDRVVGKRYLRDTLEEMMRQATIEGRHALTEEEEDELIYIKHVRRMSLSNTVYPLHCSS
jgi:hypothetical protein